MAILNQSDKELLARISAAKDQYDIDEEMLQAAILTARSQNKSIIRELVEEAVGRGTIPMRQIHIIGLHLGQINQMKAFLAVSGGGNKQAVLDILNAAAQRPVLSVGERVKAKVKVTQFGAGATFINQAGVKVEIARRPYWKPGIFIINQFAWDRMTEEYREIMLGESVYTLIGDDEFEIYEEDGTVPDRWVGYVPPAN